MRINGRQTSRDVTPDKSIVSSTPVIVSVGGRLQDSVIKGPERAIKSPLLYRSTVISPNPKRILYSTIKHPSVIQSANNKIGKVAQQILEEQPVDFSSNRDRQTFQQNSERTSTFPMGLAITV